MHSHQPNEPSRGSVRSVPVHRRTILDVCRESQSVPSFPLLYRMQLDELQHARAESPVRIGWTTLFVRAFAILCQQKPELRDVFIRYPTHRIYRHPHSVASISIHRSDDERGERLIFGRFVSPDEQSLVQLQLSLENCCTAPLKEVYREGLILERQPAVLRRISWWLLMNWFGRKRAKHVGTFSISTLAGQGVLNCHHPLVTTTSLSFGPLDENGYCDVLMLCDHRVIDGMLASQSLKQLEVLLQTNMVEELREIAHQTAMIAA
jgi:hypothetical protein